MATPSTRGTVNATLTAPSDAVSSPRGVVNATLNAPLPSGNVRPSTRAVVNALLTSPVGPGAAVPSARGRLNASLLAPTKDAIAYFGAPGGWRPVFDVLTGTPSTFVLPDVPTVRWQDLYRAGDTPQQTLSRLGSSPRAIILPSGFDIDVSDFTMGGGVYGLYHDNLLGFIGPGKNQARIRLAPMSSTKAGTVPAQGSGGTNQLYIARVGRANTGLQYVMAGLTIEGTPQPNNVNSAGGPHWYGGFMLYRTVDAVVHDMLVKAIPGGWNSPPGETFANNDYRCVRSLWDSIEVDGFDAISGIRVGGSPLGGNSSVDLRVENCDFHDARVSSITDSFAGTHTDAGAMPNGWRTKNLKVHRNANWQMAAGQRFPGINHENVIGTVIHDHPDILMGSPGSPWGTEWVAAHTYIGNYHRDNPDITFIEPEWHGQSYSRYRGAFTVAMDPTYAGAPNRQTTPPVVIKNGRRLTPVMVTSAPPGMMDIDPTRQFVVLRG